jgi:hypothetical protein
MATATTTPTTTNLAQQPSSPNLTGLLSNYQGTPLSAQSIQPGLAQVQQNTVPPDASGQMKTAQKAAGSDPLSQAALAGFQSQVGAAGKMAQNQSLGLGLKAQSTQDYLTNIRSSATTAIKAQQDFANQMDAYKAMATAAPAQMDEKSKTILDDFKATVNDWSQAPERGLPDKIEALNYGYLQSSKDNLRSIGEQYGENSAEYQQAKEQRVGQLAVNARTLIGQAADLTTQMLTSGISGAANLANTQMQNVSWGTKYMLDAVQGADLAVAQNTTQTMAFLNSIDALQHTALSDLGDAFANSPVMAVDTAPLVATLLDIQRNQAAQQPTNSWTMTGIPASWSQGLKATA